MICPICSSMKTKDLKKSVRGCDKAKVYFCSDCKYAFLIDCTIEKDYYKEEYDTFLAERSKDNSWVLPIEHARNRIVEARERLKLLSKYLRFREAESILELGCSSGFVLQALNELYPGKKLWGVEPSHRHREYALNSSLNVVASNKNLGKRKFDIIIAFFVLEHIRNPELWLKKVCGFAKQDATILMMVPNGREALVSTYPKSNYDQFIWQAPHLSYFSEKSLKILLSKINKNSNVYQYQRYSLNNHLNWVSGIKPQEAADYKHISSGVDLEYKKSLITHGIADTLLGVLQI